MPLDRALAAPDPREQTVQFWVSKGAPRHVAEGIADRLHHESGFNPLAIGDNGTSAGLYQEHADRKARLQSLPNWQNPMVQHQNAYHEVTGGDAIATKHWPEILAAPDRATAAKLWDKYFERSAGGVGGGGRRMVGRFGGMGPRVEEESEEDPAKKASSRLAKALEAVQPAPVATPQPTIPGTPPVPRPLALRPVAVPQAPSLHQAYTNALMSILNGKRRPFGSIFG